MSGTLSNLVVVTPEFRGITAPAPWVTSTLERAWLRLMSCLLSLIRRKRCEISLEREARVILLLETPQHNNELKLEAFAKLYSTQLQPCPLKLVLIEPQWKMY